MWFFWWLILLGSVAVAAGANKNLQEEQGIMPTFVPTLFFVSCAGLFEQKNNRSWIVVGSIRFLYSRRKRNAGRAGEIQTGDDRARQIYFQIRARKARPTGYRPEANVPGDFSQTLTK